MNSIATIAGAGVLAALSLTVSAEAQIPKEKPTDVSIEGYVYKPMEVKPTADFAKSLSITEKAEVSVFDEGLSNTRMLAIGDDAGKRLYVTRRDQGDCLLLKDENLDGKADGEPVTVAKAEQMHGIALHKGKAYLVTVKDVYVADIKDDGSLGEMKKIISDLPDGGQHPNRTIAVGPDEKLYISVGSTCNACKETNKESATMLRAELDGTTRTVFASGLRNTIGFGWHPVTKQMWGMDHGVDWLGNDSHKEELNLLEEGKFYGWPFILGEGQRNPQDEPPPGQTFEQLEAATTLPELGYTAHSAPMQMAFAPKVDSIPEDMQGDAVVAMRGSWNRKPPSGYEVVRIHFDENGKPEKFEPFIKGFLKGEGDNYEQYGRLAGLAIVPDGSAMFMSDDKNGVIYRVAPAK